MSEHADTTVLADDDWLSTPIEDTAPAQLPESGRRTLAVRAGLVAAGAVVGGIVVASMHHNASTNVAPASFVGPGGQFQGGQLPGGQLPGGQTGQLPGPPQAVMPGGGSGFGGLSGEQRISGTVVAVGSSSVTVRTASGTATYLVTASSEIVRNGRQAALSAVHAGDPVFLHVYPSGSGTRLTVERLFAGSSATA